MRSCDFIAGMAPPAGLRTVVAGAALGLALAAALSCCGGGPCGSRVIIVDAAPGDAGIDCSVCGYPVLSCNVVTVESNEQERLAVSCNIANVCPGS